MFPGGVAKVPGRPEAPSGASARTVPRVLLVDPYLARADPMERKFVELYPSLGVLTLAAVLRARGIEVRVTDLTFARSTAGLRSDIRAFQPHVVGVHTKTLTFLRSLEAAHIAREAGAVAVAGGPDATTRPGDYLEGGFDTVGSGEGEETLAEIAWTVASGGPIDGVSGTIVGKPGALVRGPPRPFLKDLDRLPLPAWDLIDLDRYLEQWRARTGERRMAVLTSRGCPFDCSWCSKPTFGRTFRQQSPARVLDELRALKDRYRVDYVRFCDDVFGIQRRWLEELLDGMIREQLGLQFECLARVELLKPDLLKRMRQAGLARVYLGVESGSQRMLDTMNRGTRLHQVERAAAALRKEGVRQYWFLMLGYPGETLEDVEETLRLFRRFSPEEYSVSIAVPIPGTRFYETVKDRLVGTAPRRHSSGGDSLLYIGAYPESMYRWQQRRFRIDAALRRARGRLPGSMIDGASRTLDRLHERVAKPILLGSRRREAASGPSHGTELPLVPPRHPPAEAAD